MELVIDFATWWYRTGVAAVPKTTPLLLYTMLRIVVVPTSKDKTYLSPASFSLTFSLSISGGNHYNLTQFSYEVQS